MSADFLVAKKMIVYKLISGNDLFIINFHKKHKRERVSVSYQNNLTASNISHDLIFGT